MGCGMRHTNDSIFASTNAQAPMFTSVEGRSTYCNGSKNLKAWSVIYFTPSSTMSFSQVNPGSLPFLTPPTVLTTLPAVSTLPGIRRTPFFTAFLKMTSAHMPSTDTSSFAHVGSCRRSPYLRKRVCRPCRRTRDCRQCQCSSDRS